MKAKEFIEAFREGRKLRNGDLEIDDGYFQLFGMVLLILPMSTWFITMVVPVSSRMTIDMA